MTLKTTHFGELILKIEEFTYISPFALSITFYEL